MCILQSDRSHKSQFHSTAEREMKTFTYFMVTSILTTPSLIYAQQNQHLDISNSVNTFGINVLAETINQGGDVLNVALSTYSIWTLMAALLEGSRDNTLRQLESTLRLPSNNKVLIRYNYQNLSRYMNVHSNAVTLETESALFTNQDFTVKRSFEDAALQYYGIPITPINFKAPTQAAGVINQYVAKVTRNRIPVFVNAGDVSDAQVFMASLMYFKGLWRLPFNKTATHRESFYDEKNNKIGEVEMMYLTSVLPYSRLEELNAHAIELPYGRDGQISMVVVLPFKGESISGVLNKMSKMTFSTILRTLDDADKRFMDESINVYLPKFKITSDFNLNVVLSKIGIKDAFDSQKANLLDMFDQYLYLSRLIQKAEIDVDEQGTTASAAAGAAFENKAFPAKFKANKPFLYFIVNKPTKTIIFAGKVSNPDTLK